jgi:NAD(P)H-hydrate repair Nnr-like enzyme with NAD(P)H-hydrate dehydratase domain
VLTGVVATFLAKGLDPQLAAAAAAAAQQRASVEAPQRAGLVAGDLIDALPRALA